MYRTCQLEKCRITKLNTLNTLFRKLQYRKWKNTKNAQTITMRWNKRQQINGQIDRTFKKIASTQHSHFSH